MLASKTASLIKADQLVILSDVDGLYNCNPKTNKAAKIIHEVSDINQSIFCFVEESHSMKSRGGMQSKLESARLATSNGIETFIGNGNAKNILVDLLINKKENVGTKFTV